MRNFSQTISQWGYPWASPIYILFSRLQVNYIFAFLLDPLVPEQVDFIMEMKFGPKYFLMLYFAVEYVFKHLLKIKFSICIGKQVLH